VTEEDDDQGLPHMAFKSTYQSESDADDEFERSDFISPTLPPGLSPSESEEMTSPEHTPTYTQSHSGGSHASPTSLIIQWSPQECAEFMSSLGLGQYGDAVMGENAHEPGITATQG